MDSAFPKVWGVDSRFRGNDSDMERRFLANDTTAHPFLRYNLFPCPSLLVPSLASIFSATGGISAESSRAWRSSPMIWSARSAQGEGR